MKTLRAGVIGLGVGEQHVLGYQRIPGCTVAAICDVDPVKLAAVGERTGVERRSTDYQAITDDPTIDVVSVCSHDDAHAKHAIAALRAGKHVMVEKPLALYRAEAEAIHQAWRDSGKLLTSNLILRRSPRFYRLRERIRSGEFGTPYCIEGDYLHDILWKLTEGWRGRMDYYCVVYGGGIHLIDLMRWLLGREVVEVAAMGSRISAAGSIFPNPDTVSVLLRFEDGAVGKSLTTFGPRRPKFHSLNLFGTAATYVNDMPHGKIYRSDDPEIVEFDETPYPGISKFDLLPGFVEAIRHGTEPPVSARDVFRVMDVCFAVRRALEENRTIKVEYLVD